jgi:hypothetical protein
MTNHHRVLCADGTWKKIRDIAEGDAISCSFLQGGLETEGVVIIQKIDVAKNVCTIITLEDGMQIGLAADGSVLYRQTVNN